LAAAWNIDGSFRHPILAAMFLGAFWSLLVLMYCWLILAYCRHRLVASSDSVRVTNCFTYRHAELANVQSAVWRSFPRSGALVLVTESTSVKVYFGNYTVAERLELIQFFRSLLNSDKQVGWIRFSDRCVPTEVDPERQKSEIRRHLSFALVAWVAAMPAMYALLVWHKVAGGLPRRSFGRSRIDSHSGRTALRRRDVARSPNGYSAMQWLTGEQGRR
jgi:hypothetical protein